MREIEYVLGHGDHEVRRLELQASLFAPGTKRVLQAIGLEPGMSVLDIGTGPGDVAMLAAAFVGAEGSVLGIDREASVLERARIRASTAGLSQVQFKMATLDDLPEDAVFDLVVGRYLLMHQGNPAAFLRRAAGFVRPGGRLAFIEPGVAAEEAWSSPAAPPFDAALGLIKTALDSVGSDVGAGAKLVRLFRDAGLPQPSLVQDVPTGGPGSPIIEWGYHSVRSLMPQLEKIGATSADAIGLDTLRARMEVAVAVAESQVRCYNLVGGWAKIY